MEPLVKVLHLLHVSEEASLGDRPASPSRLKWEVHDLWLQFWLADDTRGQYWLILNSYVGSPPIAEFHYVGGNYGQKLHELMQFLGRCLTSPRVTNVKPVLDGDHNQYLKRLEVYVEGALTDWWDRIVDAPSPPPKY